MLTYYTVLPETQIVHRLVHCLLNLLPITPPLDKFVYVLPNYCHQRPEQSSNRQQLTSGRKEPP